MRPTGLILLFLVFSSIIFSGCVYQAEKRMQKKEMLKELPKEKKEASFPQQKGRSSGDISSEMPSTLQQNFTAPSIQTMPDKTEYVVGEKPQLR